MLINIQGYIIDTTKIYAIGDIIPNIPTESHILHQEYEHYGFPIFFINKKNQFNINHKMYFETPNTALKAKEKRIVEFINGLTRITLAREELIKYWQQDPSPIPEIKI